MGYTAAINEMAKAFADKRALDANHEIIEFAANSEAPPFGIPADESVWQNRRFSYFVVRRAERNEVGEKQAKIANRAIMLFHGLNERSWVKYLPWAAELSDRTGSPVILFPIAFHMDRAPRRWSDPRQMREVSVERRARHPGIVASSFANAALSSRLEEMPERFLLSGYQTVEDVTRIADQIRTGNHPLFPSRTRLDFFGYSIGAFLTEMLMLRTDRDDFRTSRALLFCGGSTLSGMRPVSRLIMDSVAGSTIDEYFTRRFEADAAVNRAVCWIFERVQSLGVLFRSFVAPQMFQSVREERIRSAADRITAIALAGDTVVPDSAIRQTLVPESSGQANAHSRAPELHLFDFPFPYDHEHPFPVFRDPEASEQVDEAFSRVFAAASAALE